MVKIGTGADVHEFDDFHKFLCPVMKGHEISTVTKEHWFYHPHVLTPVT